MLLLRLLCMFLLMILRVGGSFSRYGYFDDVVEFVFEDAVGFFDFG